MHRMRFPFPSRFFGRKPEPEEVVASPPPASAAQILPELAPALKIASNIHPVAAATIANWRNRPFEEVESTSSLEVESAPSLLRTVGWVSAGLGAIALGLVVGRELRQRYKFTRRTPYDFYAHAGDERDMEFGVGI